MQWNGTVRMVLALVLGCMIAVATASAETVVARALWPAYAVAEPHKQYTPGMLLVRLGVGVLSVAAAACGATAAARDRGRAAWWLGCLSLALSVPEHVYPGYVRHDYPVWYHLVYLAYLVPVAGLSAPLFVAGSSRVSWWRRGAGPKRGALKDDL